MALTDPTQTRITDLDNATTSYTAGQEPWNKNLDGYKIDSVSTEAITYQMDWDKWHGMYREIPELRSTVDTESRWIIGKRLIMSEATKKIVSRFTGKGKDTIRKILLNIKRTSKIGGDCYVWAPRDKAGRLINLKILDPGSIETQADKFGVIKKYVQVSTKATESKLEGNQRIILDEFDPKEIFHVMNDPIADEIHGIPDPEKMQTIVKMRHQAMSDQTLIFHRYGKPTYFFEADTEDDAELADVTKKLDNAFKNFENVVTPKGTLTDINRVAIPQFSSMDFQPWMNFLRSYFTESSGVPDLVRGKSDEVSLAAGKLNLVSYKEMIEYKQIEFSEDIEKQLGLKISFEKPIEIDIEISRTEEDQNLKESAKKEAGGNLTTPNKTTSEKK